MKRKITLLTVILLLILIRPVQGQADNELKIEYEKYTLSNGLTVVLHHDDSDPIVAVAIQYHVGSNREEPGKTGFAHLFEHMMFQQSENVGEDQLFKLIQGAGGTLNGGTNKDGTSYYEVVPKNALELVLWLESDRMGYLENTVTNSAFTNQQNIVQNEKRQRYDNAPYGYTNYIIDKNLFPKSHPYSWQVIGEMADLFNATTEDVKEFHRKYYVPNNATLTLAGDFETNIAKSLIEKYFGEIPGGNKVVDLKPMPVKLNGTKKLYHEDNFAKTPEATMVWPIVEQYHPDSYALSFLGQILSQGKNAPLYKVLVKEKKLTSNARAFTTDMELAGKFVISVNAYPGKSLKDVEQAINEAFVLFEEEGISDIDMEKIKASMETSFYSFFGSVLNKARQLASYNEFAGSPGFVTQDLNNIQSVTIEDVKRVYQKYIKDKPFVFTSFVPKGSLDLIAEGSVSAGIIEESVLEATEVSQAIDTGEAQIQKTPSSFDRSVMPKTGADPEIKIPEIWTGKLSNGIGVWGTKQSEIPVIQYALVIDGGHILDSQLKAGTAYLLARLMNEGTVNKTPQELEDEMALLGASIGIYSTNTSIVVSVRTLARNFEKTVALVTEMLLEPRWDKEEFELIKQGHIKSFVRNKARPEYMAEVTFQKLLFGDAHLFSTPYIGTEETIGNINMEDLKQYYNKNLSPSISRLHVVGDIDKDRFVKAFAGIEKRWKSKKVLFPKISLPENPEKSKIFFIDFPGAKQSVIMIGNVSIPRTNPDFSRADVVNYKLGGAFNGIVNMILREEKGFTYGARTGFSGDKYMGRFTANSSVRTTSTLESVQIFKEEMEKYRQGIDQEGIDFTKDALLKSNARSFETHASLISMLTDISAYNLPFDYLKREEEFIRNLTIKQHKEIALKYIDPSRMYYLIAGDAETQLEALKTLGMGDPVLVK